MGSVKNYVSISCHTATAPLANDAASNPIRPVVEVMVRLIEPVSALGPKLATIPLPFI